LARALATCTSASSAAVIAVPAALEVSTLIVLT